MPLTAKGREILANMEERYGQKKGKEVFYASKNKGTISGVDSIKEDATLADAAKLDALVKACDAYDGKR